MFRSKWLGNQIPARSAKLWQRVLNLGLEINLNENNNVLYFQKKKHTKMYENFTGSSYALSNIKYGKHDAKCSAISQLRRLLRSLYTNLENRRQCTDEKKKYPWTLLPLWDLVKIYETCECIDVCNQHISLHYQIQNM